MTQNAQSSHSAPLDGAEEEVSLKKTEEKNP